ncbi:MAG: hypothetical protein KIT11_10335 [Fimbriimonadaceae bacterium]|nr:hypothetical protein [Fimbriimonadaceae bacterium]QYK55719.1 MAG: hypothetical protein KF733_12005 [Fimbriimonadaceae bacterium]
MNWKLALSLVAAAAVGALGCNALQAQVGTQEKGQRYETMALEQLPYKDARLVLVGTEMDVEMGDTREGRDLSIHLRAHGEDLETEHYEVDQKGLWFVGVSGEAFEPPIPLAIFPITVGDSWDWSGTAELGPLRKPAKAKVSTDSERLNLATGVYNTIRIQVDLDIETGDHAAKRKLRFWISPESGVVKRAFGDTTREPRSPSESQ